MSRLSWWCVGLALAIAGCKSADAPSGFGVNLSIKLADDIKAQTATVTLAVGGGENFEKPGIDATAFPSGEAHIHYVPGITSGTLVFTAVAFSSSGAELGAGSSGTVTLVAGQAVSASILVEMGGAVPDLGVADLSAGPDMAISNLPLGSMCAGATQCTSGFCVDGVCCESKCDGSCNACNLANKMGSCWPVAAGSPPVGNHPSCGPDNVSTCMRDGMCDGAGACELYALNTQCKASTCDATSNQYTPAATCNGSGVCQTPAAITCAPFDCQDTKVCFSACTDSTQCSGTNLCLNGSCGLKVQGATCGTNAECKTGFCADGVCCNNACSGTCTSCNQATANGTCTAVPVGQDPHNTCPAGTGNDATCTPGGCDGTFGSKCQKSSTTTQCSPPSCMGGVGTLAGTCTTSGTCGLAAQKICNPYLCGSSACDSKCSPAGSGTDCVSGYYCDTTGACQAAKGAGVGCAQQYECQNGLTCLDGVCCTTPTCPTCRNCGAGGMCSVTVASTVDNTGLVCNAANICDATGTCKSALGQACGNDTSCASGHCVDGVCCGAATCGTCLNCGSTGSCNVAVKNADDTSANTCMQTSSCDPTGTCKLRWQQVAAITVPTPTPYNIFTAGLGNKIYFANDSGQDAASFAAQWFKSFDVTTSAVADEAKTNNTMCACGYESYLVPANGSLYYFANPGIFTANGFIFTPGNTSWTTVASYTGGAAPVVNGETASAAVGSHLYRTSGRSMPQSVTYFDTAALTWTTLGAGSNFPGTTDNQPCGGAYNGHFYVFGGNSPTVYVLDTATNTWSTLPASSNYAGSCSLHYAPVWRNKLVVADFSGFQQFDPASNTWAAVTALPPGNLNWTAVTAGASSDLYLVGYQSNSTTVVIDKWVFN